MYFQVQTELEMDFAANQQYYRRNAYINDISGGHKIMHRRRTAQKYNRRIALWYSGINSWKQTLVCDISKEGFAIAIGNKWQRSHDGKQTSCRKGNMDRSWSGWKKWFHFSTHKVNKTKECRNLCEFNTVAVCRCMCTPLPELSISLSSRNMWTSHSRFLCMRGLM